MATPGEFTAEGLREVASDEFGTYVLHRHAGDHAEGTDCWCHPLVLRHVEVFSMTRMQLQRELDTFYRIH